MRSTLRKLGRFLQLLLTPKQECTITSIKVLEVRRDVEDGHQELHM